MTDSFNPQELLSKLRAKSANSTAASVPGSVHDQQMRRNSFNPEAEQKAGSANRVQAVNNIRTPIALTLTPSQRQENLNARLELEKEIKRLQDEVTNLMSENMQLKRDKEDVEQQFMDFRIKSEETITKLRGTHAQCIHCLYVHKLNLPWFPCCNPITGKIASMTINGDGFHPDRGAGAGRLYGPRTNESGGAKLNTSLTRSPTAKKGTPQASPHVHSHGEAPPPPPPVPQGGFRDPTFSELMRRLVSCFCC